MIDRMVGGVFTFQEWEAEFWRRLRLYAERRKPVKWFMRIRNLDARLREMFDDDQFPSRAARLCVAHTHVEYRDDLWWHHSI